ncbi:MAG: type II toxin-antitoxin system prevent-host-death family antitoxin [Trichloromonas sp.]|jgi:antitoxin StbD|nr:type II toxin-antitoxin system prevent-host-death family antitoxin [Trichloromonas sp.]
MDLIFASASVSISDLKKNPSRVIIEAEGAPVAILNHNKPSAYLVPAETFEAVMEKLEEYELAKLVEERAGEATVKVSLDDL